MLYYQLIIILATFILKDIYLSNAEQEMLGCTSKTCRNGECEQLKNGYLCHCDKGNKGKNCEYLLREEDNHCASNPCWNGATCRNLNDDFRCECMDGFSGKNCREIRNFACVINNPCKNNGICSFTHQGLVCNCIGEWTGPYCSKPRPACSEEESCYNGGSCINEICICPKDFIGSKCETHYELDEYPMQQFRIPMRKIKLTTMEEKMLPKRCYE